MLALYTKDSHARYIGPIVCYDCGCECSAGYVEKLDSDSDGYSETLIYCADCARKEGF